MKKRVVHVIYDLDTAGAQTVVMNLLRSFQDDEDYEFSVVVGNTYQGLPYEKEANDKGFEVIYANYNPCIKYRLVRPLINWFRYQYKMFKAIKSLKPDIIHTHLTGILPYVCIPATMICKRRVHTFHSDPYAMNFNLYFWALLSTHVFRFKPVGVTESQAEKVRQRYLLSSIDVVHNGLYLKKYKVAESKDAIREELGIAKDAFLIGSVGRHDPIKNYSFLLKLFYEYSKINSKAQLALIGHGTETQKLQQLVKSLGINDKVIFFGLRNDVERLYKAMDLFMLTSFFESSSIVTVEAQLSEIRCVVSDAIPDSVIISNKVNRLSLDTPTEIWLDAIDGKLPADRKTNSIDDFSMQKTVREIKSIYSKV